MSPFCNHTKDRTRDLVPSGYLYFAVPTYHIYIQIHVIIASALCPVRTLQSSFLSYHIFSIKPIQSSFVKLGRHDSLECIFFLKHRARKTNCNNHIVVELLRVSICLFYHRFDTVGSTNPCVSVPVITSGA